MYWKDFKRILEGLRQKSERAYSEGRNISLPSWYVDRVDISFERARESAQRITKYALGQDEDYLAKSLAPSKGSLASAGVNPLAGALECQNGALNGNSEDNLDPWTDEAEEFLINGYINFGYLTGKAKVISKAPGNLSLFVSDFRAAWRKVSGVQRMKIRDMLRQECPKLLSLI